MWATPPNVDLRGLCRAHHLPHSLVTDPADLLPTLRTAWALNSSSIVEVTTTRDDNVAIHRALQAQCTQTAWKVLNWNLRIFEGFDLPEADSSDAPQKLPSVLASLPTSQSNACIDGLSVREFTLPLRQPLTTGSTSNHRYGCTVVLYLRNSRGDLLDGSGEVSPLPGLHAESLTESKAQLAALAQVLQGITVPENISLLDGELEQWWKGTVGVATDSLLPSVRFAVESALVAAMAHACGADSLAEHLFCLLYTSPSPRD